MPRAECDLVTYRQLSVRWGSGSMHLRLRTLTVFVVLGAALARSPAFARAEPPPDRQRAAATFDAAVARFNRAEFAEAARGFFEADELAPSVTAITNAI